MVQLELSPVATPFEHRLYGVELALCQRYYWSGNLYGLSGYADITNIVTLGINLPVALRVIPSLLNAVDASGSGIVSGGGLYNTTANSAVISNSWWSGSCGWVSITTNSQITRWTTVAGRIIGFQANAEL